MGEDVARTGQVHPKHRSREDLGHRSLRHDLFFLRHEPAYPKNRRFSTGERSLRSSVAVILWATPEKIAVHSFASSREPATRARRAKTTASRSPASQHSRHHKTVALYNKAFEYNRAMPERRANLPDAIRIP